MDIDQVCRTCLKENAEMQSIFTDDTCNSLPTMITACTVTTVSELDGLPAQMCLQCIQNVQTSFDFKKQCESAYETLKSVLGIHIHNSQKIDDGKPAEAIDCVEQSLAFIAPGGIIDFDSDLDGIKLEAKPLLDNPNEKCIQTDETSFFSCEMCSAKFMQDQELRAHRFIHKDDGFKCRVCEKIYSRLVHLQQHFAFKHPNEPVAKVLEEIVCKLCNKQFSRRDHLKRHMLIHSDTVECKSFKCNECDESFTDERDYLNHEDCWGIRKSNGPEQEEKSITKHETQSQSEEEEEEEDIVLATLIATGEQQDTVKIEGTIKDEKNETSDDDADADMQPEPYDGDGGGNDANASSSDDEDENDEVYTPDITLEEQLSVEVEQPKRRGRPPKQATENQKSSKKTPFEAKVKKQRPKEKIINKCDICEKVFSRATHLKRHMVTHSDIKPYACNMCDKKFSRIDHLNIHRFHHSEVKPHICDVCQRGFTRAEHLRKHKEARHGDKTGQAPKTEFCSVCQKGFTTPKYLQVHMRSHTDRIFACKFCDEKFGSKAALNEHQKKHINERPFLCSECGLRFVRNDYLVIHMRRHKGEKPYKCKYCNKGFPRATDLTVHERYHTGEKTHLCTICGKGFQRAYNLLVHTRVHTGERPYQCPHCVKSFAQGNDLKAHVRRHTGERYKCDVCGDGFIQGYHLTQHKRTVHGIDMKSHIRRVEKVPGTTEGPEDVDLDVNNMHELHHLQQLQKIQHNGVVVDELKDITMLNHIKMEPNVAVNEVPHIDITDSQSSDVVMLSNRTDGSSEAMDISFVVPHSKLQSTSYQ